jgi:arsenical pump membrane protein
VHPIVLSQALEQVWPAFVLVSGLLLIGLVANADGLFEHAGAALQRLPGGPAALLVASLLLVTVVTAVLNLDTAVVFLTPILVHAARRRGVEEEPFLYGAVFVANASSLYLPGSNLTNLIVLRHAHLTGATFATRMLPIALAATFATIAGLLVVFRARLAHGATPERGGGHERAATTTAGLGLPAAICAAALTVALGQPALAVLGLGVLCAAVELARGRLRWRAVLRALGPATLFALFALSVALGVLARSWDGPYRLLDGTSAFGTTATAALASVLVNNLPASMLLASRPLAHPRALLIGLNVGPNLAASGSLSALLWLRASRQVDARPSLLAFSRRGVPLALLAIGASLVLASTVAGSS